MNAPFRNLRRSVLAAALLAVALAPAARADLDPRYDPRHLAIPPLHAIKTYKPQRFVLPNGMVIYLQEDHQLPKISGSYFGKASSGWEPAAKVGLGEMTGTVLRSGGTATH